MLVRSARVPRGRGHALLAAYTPTGGFRKFRLVESPVMEPELAARFPDIKTYRGQGVDDPAATANVRLDVAPQGFHAMVLLTPEGDYFIDPYSRGDVDR
jgi:hypothetical protein